MPPDMGERWFMRRLTPYWLALGIAVAAHALMLTLPWSWGDVPAASNKPLAVQLNSAEPGQSAHNSSVKTVTLPPHPASPAPPVRAAKQLVSTARIARAIAQPHHSHNVEPTNPNKAGAGAAKSAVPLARHVVKPLAKPVPAPPATHRTTPPVAAIHKPQPRPAPPLPRSAKASTSTAGAPEAAQASRSHYRSRLEQYLARFRHYPLMARQEGQQGQVIVHFVMDRQGHILSQQLERRTPFPLLNHEALALLQRAQPLPQPPNSLSGMTLAWTLPINFRLP